jgi:hypothetical protein
LSGLELVAADSCREGLRLRGLDRQVRDDLEILGGRRQLPRLGCQRLDLIVGEEIELERDILAIRRVRET